MLWCLPYCISEDACPKIAATITLRFVKLRHFFFFSLKVLDCIAIKVIFEVGGGEKLRIVYYLIPDIMTDIY